MQKMISKMLFAASLSISFGLLNVQAVAAERGDTPDGRPFQAIESALEELFNRMMTVEQRVDALTSRVDSVEAAVAANTAAIGMLQDQIDNLEMSIMSSLDDINNKISELETDIATLQGQIQENAGDIDMLQMQVAAKMMLIMSLTQRVSDVENGLMTLEQALQMQIDQNAAMINMLKLNIAALQQDLQMKQNRVNGVCATGFAIRQITANGSVICDRSTDTVFATASMMTSLPPGEQAVLNVSCPAGFNFAVGGGYFGIEGVILSAVPVANFYLFITRNDTPFTDNFEVTVRCASVRPDF